MCVQCLVQARKLENISEQETESLITRLPEPLWPPRTQSSFSIYCLNLEKLVFSLIELGEIYIDKKHLQRCSDCRVACQILQLFTTCQSAERILQKILCSADDNLTHI